MEGVVAGVVTGTMKPLLTKLTTLLERKYKLSKGVRKEISCLRDEMSSMNALLVTLSEAGELNAQEKEWRDKVRELSYDMEDCIDIFANDTAGGGSDRAGIFKKLKAHYKIAKRIEELKARMVEANDCRGRYWLGSSISRPYHHTVDPRIQEFYEDGTARLVGTDRARDKIIGWLVEGEQLVSRPCFQPWNFSRFLQELLNYFLQNFFKAPVKSVPSKGTKVITIVGTGGVGKTALANQVYGMVKSQFNCTASVPVSRNPNWVKIFLDVLSGFGKFSDLPDERRLIGQIQEHLKDKRYLIVFDDVWTKEAWNKIARSLAIRNSHDSRVIITTRVQDVAWAWQPLYDGHVYKMEYLNDLDSRKLFNRRMFGSEHACPEQLEAVSCEIIKKCGGLPLAIHCVTSILASRHEMVYSNEIWENLRFQLERNPGFESMRYVLNLGYDDLSPDLKTCMLYLGIFPEDSRITKIDLVKRWVAEGFVTGKHGSDAEEIAGFYFNELINRNIIQVADIDDCGDVLSCRVHDVMLDFIILKSTEENFITIMNDLQSTKGSSEVRRLSLQIRNSEWNTQGLGDITLVQARSLNFWGPSKCVPSLTKFLVLRVLHLDVYGTKSEQCDLSSMRKFFQLRYLRISGIDCNKLRRQLCELQHLKTLEILPTTPMKMDVGDLPVKLRHLVAPSTVKLIGRIDRMKALRTLEELDIDLKDVESNDKGLGELTNLRELTLSLSHDAQRGNNVGDLLIFSLCRLISLNSLTIYRSLVDADALVHWIPPPCSLRRLHALACPFSIVPAHWIYQLKSLRSLEIMVVSLTKDGVEDLARMTLLVHLRLHVEKHVPEEGVTMNRPWFPDLKEFWFAYQVPCLMFKEGAMPNLQTLNIQCYANAVRQRDGVLDGIEYLGSLKSCKVVIVNYPAYILQGAYGDEAQEHVSRWNNQVLRAAFKKAIKKHPGSPNISIITSPNCHDNFSCPEMMRSPKKHFLS